MKTRLVVLCLLIASACFAQEIKFTSTPWDSLAIPLDLSAYYLSVDSSAQGGSVGLELDLYIKGRFVRTISAGGMSIGDKASPLKANCALYMGSKDKENIRVTYVVDFQGGRASGKFDLPYSEFPMKEGTACSGNGTKIAASGRTPVFTLLAGASSSTFSTVAEDAPKANPTASVIIAYLKTK